MTDATTAHLEEFEAAVARSDEQAATAVVERLVAMGIDPLSVLLDVVAVAQRRVGRRWLSGEWSVAQEHAATAIAMSALESVGRMIATGTPSRGRVVMACAEHEWHAMPAQLVAASLRTRGWQVTLLGASTPTARLNRFLQDLGPDVTAISCSVPAGLPSARAFIEASTAAGIPVLAGGAAFGPDARRAWALGATAWALDGRSAVREAEAMPRVVGAAASLPTQVTAEQQGLLSTHRATVTSVLAAWSPVLSDDEAREVVTDAVGQLVHAVVGTLMTGDERLLHETADWAEAALGARGISAASMTALGRHLYDELAGYPLAQTLVAGRWRMNPTGRPGDPNA